MVGEKFKHFLNSNGTRKDVNHMLIYQQQIHLDQMDWYQ